MRSSIKMLAFAALCFIATHAAAAQPKKHIPIQKGITVVPPKKPQANPTAPWQVAYKVTVKGEGEHKPSQFASTVFTIDRTYEGVALFDMVMNVPKTPKITPGMTQREMIQAATAAQVTSKRIYTPLPTGEKMYRNMDVAINDRYVIISYSPGEGHSYVQITTTSEWKSLGGEFTFNGGQLAIDLETEKYELAIPITPGNPFELVSISSVTDIERSLYGNGGKPTTERTAGQKAVRTSSIDMPNVPGLENGVIKRTADFDLTATEFEWDSGDLTPSKPLISGVPDSKTNVKVRITLTFNKLAPKK